MVIPLLKPNRLDQDSLSLTNSSINGVTPITTGLATEYLDSTGNYSVPAGGTASPLTTKGDLYGFSTVNARIPVGADGTVLQADSSEALGVKWGTAGTGDVTASANLTDNAIVRGDGGAKGVQTSGITIDDNNNMSGVANLLLKTTGVTPGSTEGTFYWNENEYTLDIVTGLGAVLQTGQEMLILFYNDSGSDIDNGQILHPIGGASVGGVVVPTVELADASDYEKCQGTLFVATHDVLNGEIGFGTIFGKVRGLDTTTLGAGAQVWLSDTTPGGFVNTRPQFPSYIISLGGTLNSDASNGEIFVNQTTTVEDTVNDAWDGAIRETFDFRITSDGATITGTLTNPHATNTDLTLMFSTGIYIFDAPADGAISLTAGTATIPQANYVYIPESTKVLTVSPTGFPVTDEHCKVAKILVQDASTVQTLGALRNQNINDHIKADNDNGHILHMAERIRTLNADYEDGIAPTLSGTTANVYIATTSGNVYQMHLQSFIAQDMSAGDNIYVVNDPTTPYRSTTNLNDVDVYSDGSSWNNEWTNIVVWGVANKTGEPSHLMCNLSSAGYNSESDAIDDRNNYSNYTIPREFRGVGFLIGRFTLRRSGTSYTYNSSVGFLDLRGYVPNTTAGGGTGSSGVTDFTQLTDTPSAYTGQALSLIQVNAGETALEFTTTPTLGTPASGTLTNCTGLPISTGVSGLGANVATFLATPSSANLAAAVTDETGTGSLVFATNPTLAPKVTISDSATTAPLNLTERSAEPTTPASNDIYLDDGTNTASGNPGWRRYTGAVWEDISASAGGSFSWGATASGTSGTGLTLTLDNNSDATTIGQEIVIGDTQTNALVGQKINTGVSAINHTAQEIDIFNASVSALGTEYDFSTTGTGTGTKYTANSGGSLLNIFTNPNTDNLHTLINNSSSFTGALTGRTTDYISTTFARANNATTGTINDDYETHQIIRQSSQTGAGGTFNVTGSVLNLQNIVLNPAGTINDTTNVLTLQQDSDSTGDLINAKTGGSEVFVVEDDGNTVISNNKAGFVDLSVVNTSVAAVTGVTTTFTSGSTTGTLAVRDDLNAVFYGSTTDSEVRFTQNGNTAVTIDTNKNIEFNGGSFFFDATNDRLGIGTSTPSKEIEIKNDTNGQVAMFVNNPNTGSSARAQLYITNGAVQGLLSASNNNSSVFYGTITDHQVRFTQNNSTKMTIDSGAGAGNVGIGTTSPNQKLTIAGGTLSIQEQASANADTAGYGQIWVKNDTPNTLWFTDDAGTDVQLGVGGGGLTWNDSITYDTVNLNGVTIDSNAAAAAVVCMNIIADGASSGQRGVKVDLGTTGSGKGFEVRGGSGTAASVAAYGIVEASNRVATILVGSDDSSVNCTSMTQEPKAMKYITFKNPSTDSRTSAYLDLSYANNGGNGLTDNYDFAKFVRKTQNTTGTYSNSGSVGYFENLITSASGTLTCTTNVLELVQDTDSTGAHILFNTQSNGSTGNNNGEFWYDGTDLLLRTGAANYTIDRTAVSALRFKDNVRDIEQDTSKIHDLRPVTFEYKETGKTDHGLIAEEVEKIMPELVKYKNGEIYSVNYKDLIIPLLKEVQKLKLLINK